MSLSETLPYLTLNHTVVQRIRALISPFLFWSAVALPLLYLPLLALGVDTTARGAAFAVLLASHAIALWGSHSYTP